MPIEDELKLYFREEDSIEIDDKVQKVDYREIKNVISVKENEIIAEIIEGENGKEGKNVFGDIIKAKEKKNVKLTLGQGCILKDKTIISTIYVRANSNSEIFGDIVNSVIEIGGQN